MELRKPSIDDAGMPLYAEHDMACAVCHDRNAVLDCNTLVFQSCWTCQRVGWKTQRKGNNMFRILLLLLVSLTFVLTATGCPKQCKPKMARCLGSMTQLCRPDGKWQNVIDCSKVDPKVKWNCACTNDQTCRCKKPEPTPAPR